MKLGLAIITYNRLAALQACVAAVRRHTRADYQLVICDDGSTDGTVEWCRSEGLAVITGANRGVAVNKNRGLFALWLLGCDPVLLLEDDCHPREDGWEAAWIAAAARWGHVNYAGPEQELAPGWAEWVNGVCTVTSRAALDQVGYLDPRFLGYGAGHTEWSDRYRRALGGRWEHPEGYPVLQSGLSLVDAGSYRDAETLKRNQDLREELSTDPLWRAPARTADQAVELAAEVRDLVPETDTAELEARALHPAGTIAVVTLLTREKAYVLPQLRASFAALLPPPGTRLRFLVVIAGGLTEAQEADLAAFPQPLELHRGPEITQFAEHPWWRSLVAGELRERARRALLAAADDRVFWVDCDVLNPPDTLVRLLAHGRALASGLVLNRLGGSPISGAPITGWQRWDPREIPYQPAPADYPPLVLRPGQAQDVGWVGFGCFLVRGDLVRELSFAPYLSGEAPVWMGEDGWFCSVATERCGEPVLLDNSICPWHVAENRLALRAAWKEEQLDREVIVMGTEGLQGVHLVPRVSGYNHRLGTLTAGRPFNTDAQGRPLSEPELRELAATSRHLDLVEPEAAPARETPQPAPPARRTRRGTKTA
jgi:hypothetical protein